MPKESQLAKMGNTCRSCPQPEIDGSQKNDHQEDKGMITAMIK